jgi:hypothetical protein
VLRPRTAEMVSKVEGKDIGLHRRRMNTLDRPMARD